MITCAVIKAFMIKGFKVSAFKCGPDYIDPLFHQNVLGAKTGNLDTFLCSDEQVKYLLNEEKESDIVVMEGVMGYYDGLGGTSEKASTYDVSRATKTPSVLIINCKGMSLTLVSIIKGIIEYRQDSNIKGVILNKISSQHYFSIKEVIERELDIKVYGYLPELKEFTLKSRHLGLVTPYEIQDLQQKIYRLAVKVIETVDIDGLIELAETAEEIECKEDNVPTIEKPLSIAVAKDSAFCFYYNENLKLLEDMGAKIINFSPLEDKEIPSGVDGMILCGGYPELFTKELSANVSMRKSIHDALEKGMPCIAECGGFLYLQKTLENMKGLAYPMVGFLDGDGIKTERLVRFGYIQLETKEKTVFGDAGVIFRGHEFHYWDSTENGEVCSAVKPVGGKKWQCFVSKKNTFAGFPHIHFYSNIGAAFEFLKRCGKWR